MPPTIRRWSATVTELLPETEALLVEVRALLQSQPLADNAEAQLLRLVAKMPQPDRQQLEGDLYEALYAGGGVSLQD